MLGSVRRACSLKIEEPMIECTTLGLKEPRILAPTAQPMRHYPDITVCADDSTPDIVTAVITKG